MLAGWMDEVNMIQTKRLCSERGSEAGVSIGGGMQGRGRAGKVDLAINARPGRRSWMPQASLSVSVNQLNISSERESEREGRGGENRRGKKERKIECGREYPRVRKGSGEHLSALLSCADTPTD